MHQAQCESACLGDRHLRLRRSSRGEGASRNYKERFQMKRMKSCGFKESLYPSWHAVHAMRGGDRPSNERATEESRAATTDREFLPLTGPIQSHASSSLLSRAVGSSIEPHEPWFAVKRDFPRRGCRMGGCPFYSRGWRMAQGGSANLQIVERRPGRADLRGGSLTVSANQIF